MVCDKKSFWFYSCVLSTCFSSTKGIKGGLVNDLGKGGRGVEFVMQVLERIGTTLIERCDPDSHLSDDSQLIQCYL